MNNFLKAARGEKQEKSPVWFMRQAGRYLPEYQAIRKNVSFLELCCNPKLAAEVSLQPVELLGVDAAIVFSDILLPLNDFGFDVDFPQGGGITIQNTLSNMDGSSIKIGANIEATL
ncbi:MAG TPA: uroporphyrinogen decarboxylase family protein, partial [Vampirovibrionales bacterium]